jgi:hypothetical protein
MAKWPLALILCTLIFLLESSPVGAQILGGSDTTEIAENLYSFRHGGGRSLWVEMDNSVIVFDPMNTTAAAVLNDSIKAATDKPVSHVFTVTNITTTSEGQRFLPMLAPPSYRAKTVWTRLITYPIQRRFAPT